MPIPPSHQPCASHAITAIHSKVSIPVPAAARPLISQLCRKIAGCALLSARERQQPNRQEMLDVILRRARLLMREEGVATLSLRELARRLRFSVQALYFYCCSCRTRRTARSPSTN